MTQCFIQDCKKRVSYATLGHCSYCSAHFCLLHRLPEKHSCAKIEDCRNEARSINQKEISSQRHVRSKLS